MRDAKGSSSGRKSELAISEMTTTVGRSYGMSYQSGQTPREDMKSVDIFALDPTPLDASYFSFREELTRREVSILEERKRRKQEMKGVQEYLRGLKTPKP